MASAIVVRACLRGWREHWWSASGSVGYTLVTLAIAVWIPFVWYWDLLLPAW